MELTFSRLFLFFFQGTTEVLSPSIVHDVEMQCPAGEASSGLVSLTVLGLLMGNDRVVICCLCGCGFSLGARVGESSSWEV